MTQQQNTLARQRVNSTVKRLDDIEFTANPLRWGKTLRSIIKALTVLASIIKLLLGDDEQF